MPWATHWSEPERGRLMSRQVGPMTRQGWQVICHGCPSADFKPVNCKIYALNREEQQALDSFLEENLRSGRVRPSNSPMASLFFFIKKGDGSLRPVQDYRKLNDFAIKNRYPLPLIKELTDKLWGARYSTKLDICWGYNNVRIKEGDEWKAAFQTNRGLYEPTVMFFGLCNSLATFQRMMNDILQDLINGGHVIVYLDDILIFTKDLQEHWRLVHQVLQKLWEHHLYLKESKCFFEEEEIAYLGLIEGRGMVKTDLKKIQAVREWGPVSNSQQTNQ